MKIKKFENFEMFDGTDNEYLESPEYFVETYINGNFSQLHNMLSTFRANDRMSELIDYINSYSDDTDLVEWIAKN